MAHHASDAPEATVVVVAFRRPAALAALLDSLDGTPAEVVVVNPTPGLEWFQIRLRRSKSTTVRRRPQGRR